MTPHAAWLALGRDDDARAAAYRQLVTEAVSEDELSAIRLYLQRQLALGTERFQDAIERQLGRRVRPAPPGRPATRGRGKGF